MWLNTFAGDMAYSRAEKIAKANRGFSVDAGDYRGIRPAIAAFSDLSDLLKSDSRWQQLIDNYLPLSWEEFKSEYLCEIEHEGFPFLLRAHYPDYRIGWVVVIENVRFGSEHYFATPEFDDLDQETQGLLKKKFEENLERAKLLSVPV